MNVHSDVDRKPRYWVEENGKVLFESERATSTIQWAITHGSIIGISGEMLLEGSESIQGRGNKTCFRKMVEKK